MRPAAEAAEVDMVGAAVASHVAGPHRAGDSRTVAAEAVQSVAEAGSGKARQALRDLNLSRAGNNLKANGRIR